MASGLNRALHMDRARSVPTNIVTRRQHPDYARSKPSDEQIAFRSPFVILVARRVEVF